MDSKKPLPEMIDARLPVILLRRYHDDQLEGARVDLANMMHKEPGMPGLRVWLAAIVQLQAGRANGTEVRPDA